MVYQWADPSTLQGRVEKAVEPIISGGASSEDIENAVKSVLDIIESEIRSVE